MDKEDSDFYHRKDGSVIQYRCKACRLAEAKISYSNGGLSKLQKWRKENPELYREQVLRARENENLKYFLNPQLNDRRLELKRLNTKKNFVMGMVSKARFRSKRDGIICTITTDDIIVPTICPILGIPLVSGTKGDYQSSPSLDRVDPAKGYVPGNVRVISTMANTMKNSANYEQLMKFCTNIPLYMDNMI